MKDLGGGCTTTRAPLSRPISCSSHSRRAAAAETVLTALADRPSSQCPPPESGPHRKLQSDTTMASATTAANSPIGPRDDFTAAARKADRSLDSFPDGASCREVTSIDGSLAPTWPAGWSRDHLWNASQAAVTECTRGDADDPHPAMTRTARNGSVGKARMTDSLDKP
jgi:hypothetical protein